MAISGRTALVLCWVVYAATYLLRKPVGVGKAAMQEEMGLSASMLGMLDTAMFVPYAGVQTFFGSIADRLGPQAMLTTVLLGSGGSMIFFGAAKSIGILVVLLFLNGAFQSLAWSSCINALSAVFPSDQQPHAVGLFSTSSFAGGIIGSALAVHLMASGGSWRAMFFIPSIVLLALAAVVRFGLNLPAPKAAPHLPEKAELIGEDDTKAAAAAPEPMTTRQLLRIPLLAEVTSAYLIVKLVRYAFYMWLPLYLHKQLHYEEAQAGLLALTFEMGGVAGSAGMGWVTKEYFGGREPKAAAAALAVCAASLVLFSMTSSMGIFFNCLFMIIAGAGNCGVDPVLSGTLAIKLATQAASNGRPSPTSQVAGFINGIGSFGPVIQGLVIGTIADLFGWQSVFYTITGCSIFTAYVLFRADRAFA